MPEPSYLVPDTFRRPDGTSRFAFVTFLMINDSYLPGALVLAYALRKLPTQADLVCLVTHEISASARYALGVLFDHVVRVEQVFVPHKRRQERQDRPFMFTRAQALRLGQDGDLGLNYEKIAVLDADLLPMRHYDHLFALDAPAGIIDEHKSHVMEVDENGQYLIPPSVAQDGTWKWHRIYEDICPHGKKIPREITDRPRQDPTNMGINGSLLVWKPSMRDFQEIMADLQRPETLRLVGDLFDWPEMQYFTLYWSGQWTNVDLRFSSFSGYPYLSVLYGTHYAGFKPWSFKKATAMARWARYDDFQLWFRQYQEMLVQAYPQLGKVRRLERLLTMVQGSLAAL